MLLYIQVRMFLISRVLISYVQLFAVKIMIGSSALPSVGLCTTALLPGYYCVSDGASISGYSGFTFVRLEASSILI